MSYRGMPAARIFITQLDFGMAVGSLLATIISLAATALLTCRSNELLDALACLSQHQVMGKFSRPRDRGVFDQQNHAQEG